MDNLSDSQKKHVNIGLDIGTTSVGWAIIDNDYNVIDYGVRLFEDPCEPNKNTRRLRSLRRMLRRRKHRKERFIQLIIENKHIFSFDKREQVVAILEKETKLPWDVKVEALQSELKDKKKLIYILYHYLSHRGKTYDDDIEDNDSKLEENLNKSFDNNFSFPSMQQQEVFRLNGFLPDHFNANFTINDWKKEIEKIFDNQKCLQNADSFKKKYFDLFCSYRNFAIGPGSFKSPTKWGLFVRKYDKNLKKTIIIDRREEKGKWCKDLPSLNRGICNWYNGVDYPEKEPRVNIKTASATIFNLLDCLQNIRWMKDDSWRITKQQKIDFLYSLFVGGNNLEVKKDNKKKKTTQSDLLLRILNFKKEDINFWNTIDISNIKTALELLQIKPLDLIKSIENNDFLMVNRINKLIELRISVKNKQNFFNCKTINNIGEWVDDDEKIDLLKSIGINLDDDKKHIESDDFDNVYNKFKKLKTGGYSKFSEKALNFFIPCLLNDEKGYNSINFQEKFKKENQKSYSENNGLYISLNNIENNDDFPKSKSVSRAIKQSIRVINAILKESLKHKWIIDTITFEFCRETNNITEKDKKGAINKWYENINTEFSKEYKTNDQRILRKLRMAFLNNWKDPYDDTDIKPTPNENISDWNEKYEYDHIIPKSYFVFPDNSSSNLVVTSKLNNRKKGDNTPYLYLKDNPDWEKIHTHFTPKIPVFDNVEKKVKLYPDTNKIKKFNFQCEQPQKSEELWELCNSQRLLQDTSYTSTYLRKIVNDFFKKNSKYKNVEILSIPGKVTAIVRDNFLKLKREKELKKEFNDIFQPSFDFFNNINVFYKKRFWYNHHAIDAVIIAMVSTSKRLRMIINNFKNNFSQHRETINKIFGFEIIQKTAKHIMTEEAKYSKMLIKKTNIGFFHELPEPKMQKNDSKTIKKWEKIKILEISGNYEKYFFEAEKDKFGKKIFWNLLTEKLDKETLEQLKEIYEKYKDNKKSPFLNFMLSVREKIINDLLSNKIDEQIIKILGTNSNKINDKSGLINFIVGDLKKELCKNFLSKNLINMIFDNEEYKNIIIEIINRSIKNKVLKDEKIKKMKLKVDPPIYFYLNNPNNSKKLKIKNIHFIEVINETEEEYKATHFWHKGTKGYYGSINSIGVDLYYQKDNNKPIAIIPLNVFTIKFNDEMKKISEKKEYFDCLKEQKVISKNDYDRKIRIYKGQRLYNCEEKKYYYFSGYSNASKKFEVKPLWYDAVQLSKEIKKLKNDQNSKDNRILEIFEKFAEEWKMKKGNSTRWFEGINSFFKKYKICHANILGKVYTIHNK